MTEELTNEQIEAAIRAIEEGFNRRDPKLFESVLAPHLIDHSYALGGMDLRQRIGRVQSAFPNATYGVDGYISQGSAVAWRWTIRGTHLRDILGYRATGRDVVVSGLSMAVFEQGKVVEHWEFPDYGRLAPQLEAAAS